MHRIAIIPARGGSKRIPRKNIRRFHGKPIMAWSIKAALESNIFDSVIVSTDDDEVASVAIESGAEVPFRRPAELADDFIPMVPVIRHAINWWEENRTPVNLACAISATAPFLRCEDLKQGLQALEVEPSLEFAIGVTSFSFPIFRALRMDERGRISMFWPDKELARSQDLPPAWQDAGQFDWGTRAAWREHNGTFSAKTVGIKIPRQRVQDIDTLEDWVVAEALFAQSESSKE
jgi:pseudaminic acid cytidylyltransferase